MACFFPNKVLKYPDGRTGFLGADKVHWSEFDGSSLKKHHLLPGKYDGGRIVSVPCGKCDGCRLDQSRMWASRCVMESLTYSRERSWFITLTYDDADLGFCRDCDVGLPFNSLYPRHVTLFLKRLRERWRDKYSEDNIRYFYCGEYGDQSLRPHYHLLLFNFGLYDLRVHSKNYRGDLLYISDELSSVWSHGHVMIGELSYETCAYTARYVLKKRKQKEVNYENSSVVAEFTRMSRNPGIGVPFLQDHIHEILEDGRIYIPGSDREAVSVGLPRLFLDYIEKVFPQEFANLSAKRETLLDVSNQQFLRSLPSFDEREYFEAEKRRNDKRLESLVRCL